MNGICDMRQALAAYLTGRGVPAVTAWGPQRREPAGEAVAAVSLRAAESGPPGFHDYLGERFDPVAGQWVELYGKQVELTFGLDLYAATAEQLQEGLDRLALALSQGAPQGLRPVSFTFGETAYLESSHRFTCPAEAKFQAWATAAGEEAGGFTDFTVKGEQQ